MRLFGTVLTILAAALVCPSLGADEKAKDKDKDKDVAEVVLERIQDLNLTEDQESKIADINKEYEPKVKDAAKELAAIVKEEKDEIRNVLTDEQKAKLKEFKEENKEHLIEGLAARIARLKELDLTEDEMTKIHSIRKEYRPKIEKAMEGFKGILTPEQKKAREEALNAGKGRKEVLESLNLTDEQKKKMEGACKELRATVKEELEKIRDVLTEEQKAKLPDLKDEVKERVRDRWAHRISEFKDLDLTDEQKTKIKEIRTKYRPKVHEAGNKLRGVLREEVEKIMAVVKE
jgi:Spy/CpxP family protein refolding chaperone